MTNPRQIIDVVYDVFTDNNLSRILPVLDEQVVFYVSEYGPTGTEYHGRSGFLAMMSGLYTICDNLSVHSIVYFTPDNDPLPNAVITTGFFEGKLRIDNEPAILPFVHYWQIKAEKVVTLRAFSWEIAELFHRLRPNLPANGHHNAGNGSH